MNVDKIMPLTAAARPWRARRSLPVSLSRAALNLLLTVVSGCAVGAGTAENPPPTASAAAAAPATLAGTWRGELYQDGDLPETVIVRLQADAAGVLSGTLDVLAATQSPEVPLTQIRRDGASFSAQVSHASFNGTLSADGQEIRGTLRPSHLGLVQRLKARFFGQPTNIPMHWQRLPAAVDYAHPQARTYHVGARTVHYLEVAGAAAARVVFIHGSPGDADNWAPYLSNLALRQRATLLAVDRPGWSAEDRGQVVPDLREQARLLQPLLHLPLGAAGTEAATTDAATVPAVPTVPTVLVGWSLGGPIAAELAMDDPDAVQAAVMIAPAIDPQRDGARWYNHALTYWPAKALISSLLGDGMLWSNREILPLGPQLQTMAPRWSAVRAQLVVVQGEADGLVDPHTADFAQQSLPAGTQVVRVPGAGHGVVFTQAALQALNAVLDRVLHNATSSVASATTDSAAAVAAGAVH